LWAEVLDLLPDGMEKTEDAGRSGRMAGRRLPWRLKHRAAGERLLHSGHGEMKDGHADCKHRVAVMCLGN
jgi:hypothetical protein